MEFIHNCILAPERECVKSVEKFRLGMCEAQMKMSYFTPNENVPNVPFMPRKLVDNE